MCTPALDDLRRCARDASLVLVAPPGIMDLFQRDSRFDAVVADRTQSRAPSLTELRALGHILRTQHGPFDVAFSFKNSFSSRYFLLATGARRRVGIQNGWSDLLLTDTVRCEKTMHQVRSYSRIVNTYFGVDGEPGPLTLQIPQKHVFPRPTVGISPGSAQGDAKCWGARNYAEAAVRLSRLFDVVILGSRKQSELGDEIEAALCSAGVSNYENLVGRTTIGQLASVIAGLELFLGNDSGPMHLAAAAGVPTVAMFGPTPVYRAHPWRHPLSRVLHREMDCSPCLRKSCPLKHHNCMTQIEVAEVVEAALSLVSSAKLAEAS
jgi:heptosyltransferase-2